MTDKGILSREEEAALLNKLSEGNEQAFSRLFYAYKDKLYTFLLAITKSEEIAQDLLQDVFSKIWLQRGQAPAIDHFNAYIYRMARNSAIDALRRFSKENSILSELAYLEEGIATQDPFEELKARETLLKINKAVANLPDQQRTVYLLYKEKSYKPEQIAAELNRSVSTVRNHLMQALNNLRRHLLNIFF